MLQLSLRTLGGNTVGQATSALSDGVTGTGSGIRPDWRQRPRIAMRDRVECNEAQTIATASTGEERRT